MIDIRWTTQAADDLQAIYDFIERDSPRYALLIAEDILAGIDNLAQFPLLGRVVPERERNDLRWSGWRFAVHSDGLAPERGVACFGRQHDLPGSAWSGW